MTRSTLTIIGAALVLIGAVKAWTLMQAARFITIPSCLGPDSIVRLDGTFNLQAHCWGCYTALFGLVLIVFSSIWTKRAQKIVAPTNHT